MALTIVGIAALLASGLTMFSGFGLGTLLMPVFALFLPVELATAATALVHGANNVLKAALLGKSADFRLVLRFGVPAIVAALAGAYVLKLLAGTPVLWTYSLLGKQAIVTPLKLVMAALMAGFAVIELHPRLSTQELSSMSRLHHPITEVRQPYGATTFTAVPGCGHCRCFLLCGCKPCRAWAWSSPAASC